MPEPAAPFFTVVTVTYNSAATIADTVRSVLAQTGTTVEHLIVDGQSTDATVETARQAGHIGQLLREPDLGIYDAMNKGLRLARGRYVGFLNSDDYFAAPTVLLKLMNEAEHSRADAIWGNVVQIDDAGRPVRMISGAWAARGTGRLLLLPPHPSFYARTELLTKVGGFRLKYPIADDFDLMARLFALPTFRGRYIDELVTVMRLGGVSTNGLQSTARVYSELVSIMSECGLHPSATTMGVRYMFRGLELARGYMARARGKRYSPPAW